MKPMLAVAATSPQELPADAAAWAYEVKWDGVRVLADLREGRLRLWSRAGNEVTGGYPEITVPDDGQPGDGQPGGGRPDGIVDDVLLDGEVVVLRGGVPSFAALAERMHVRDARRAAALAVRTPATFMAFDVLRLAGEDLTRLPWQERRDLLQRVLASAPFAGVATRPGPWRLSPVYDDRDALVTATLENGLEGVVAKRRASPYLPGGRNGDWVKLAHKRVRSCLVGGWRWETGGRDRIGALLLGVPGDGGGLAFAGRVGSGMSAALQDDLRARLEPLRVASSPFAQPLERPDAHDAVWVRPQVVVDVRYLGRGDSGRLRQPVLLAVRADLAPDDLAPDDVQARP